MVCYHGARTQFTDECNEHRVEWLFLLTHRDSMPYQAMVEQAVASYQATFRAAVDMAQQLHLDPIGSLDFNTRSLIGEFAKAQFADVRTGYRIEDKRKCAIYVFTLATPCPSAQIWDQIDGAKFGAACNDGYKNLCSVNHMHRDSSTLYIGRSFTPRSRLRDHLNESSGRTYAMHLQQWAQPLALQLQVRVFDVRQYNDTPELERAVNVLETGLWDHLRPLLGRRGDK